MDKARISESGVKAQSSTDHFQDRTITYYIGYRIGPRIDEYVPILLKDFFSVHRL